MIYMKILKKGGGGGGSREKGRGGNEIHVPCACGIIGLNSFDKANLTFPCLKFIKNTWINKYVICGKQYFAV